MKKIYILIILTLLLLSLFASFAAASPDSPANEGFVRSISQLIAEDAIPNRKGTIISLGNFEDYQSAYLYQCTPLLEAQRYVFYTKLNWAATSKNTDLMKAGCGIVFHLSPETKDGILLTLRMDGNVYFDGIKNNKNFSLGYYFSRLPAAEGSAEFMAVVDGENAAVYIDGERVVRKANLPVMGTYLGLATLSAVYNENYGTRCTFEDMFLYTW